MLGSRFRFVPQAGAGLTGLALALSIAGAASAQAPAAPVEPASPAVDPASPAPAEGSIQLEKKPLIDLTTPPPPPPEVRTFQQHEGFYTRVDVGVGALFTAKSSGPLDVSTGGMTFTYDVLIGAGPAPGITLGGAAIGSIQLTGDWENDTDINVGSGNLITLVLGPFVDGFPDSKGGFHMGGSAGLGFATFDVGEVDDAISAIGLGGAFWTGWDVWVAPEWSMGALVRIDAIYAKDGDITASSAGASFMFNVLYN